MDTGESNPSASIEGRGDRPSTSGSAKNEDKVGTDKGEVISSEEEEEENPDDASEKSEDKEEAEKKEVKGQDRGDSEKEDEEAEEDTPKKETHTEKTPKKQKRTAKEETAEEESGDDEPKCKCREYVRLVTVVIYSRVTVTTFKAQYIGRPDPNFNEYFIMYVIYKAEI